MTKQEINELVEHLITLRDFYRMSRNDRDILADAINLIDHNVDKLAKEEADE